MFWGQAELTSLQLTHSGCVACGGRVENLRADYSTIGRYGVTITWQRMFTSSCSCGQGCQFAF